MSDFNGRFGAYAAPAQADMAVDAGLRAFMLGVYNKLALGLLLAAVSAAASAYYPPLRHLVFYTPLGLVFAFAPLVLVMIANFAMRNPTQSSASLIYWLVVVTMGISLGYIFIIYRLGTVASSFLVTAGAFGGLSLWGYTTKRNLGPMASFLVMGLAGILMIVFISMIGGLFAPSLGGVAVGLANNTGFGVVLNLLLLVIFSGLLAYQTQAIKMSYYQAGGSAARLGVITSFAALTLFVTFVNLFLTILRIFGGRR
jgi:FtsH-binding integral membrane protein